MTRRSNIRKSPVEASPRSGASGGTPSRGEAAALSPEQLRELYEYEQKMVAYEIHDGLVQYATGAVMQLEAYLDAQAAPPPPQLIEALALMRKTVDEGRGLIGGLRPPALAERGLVAAVKELVRQKAGQQPQVQLTCTGELGRLSPVVELVVYRIVQEALTNARNHSRSPRIEVRLTAVDHAVRVEVQDWGIGFDPQQPSEAGHGLRGIRERTALLGGQLQLTSAPGSGTLVAVQLPRS